MPGSSGHSEGGGCSFVIHFIFHHWHAVQFSVAPENTKIQIGQIQMERHALFK